VGQGWGGAGRGGVGEVGGMEGAGGASVGEAALTTRNPACILRKRPASAPQAPLAAPWRCCKGTRRHSTAPFGGGGGDKGVGGRGGVGAGGGARRRRSAAAAGGSPPPGRHARRNGGEGAEARMLGITRRCVTESDRRGGRAGRAVLARTAGCAKPPRAEPHERNRPAASLIRPITQPPRRACCPGPVKDAPPPAPPHPTPAPRARPHRKAAPPLHPIAAASLPSWSGEGRASPRPTPPHPRHATRAAAGRPTPCHQSKTRLLSWSVNEASTGGTIWRR
jgi:hypothetical protein